MLPGWTGLGLSKGIPYRGRNTRAKEKAFWWFEVTKEGARERFTVGLDSQAGSLHSVTRAREDMLKSHKPASDTDMDFV